MLFNMKWQAKGFRPFAKLARQQTKNVTLNLFVPPPPPFFSRDKKTQLLYGENMPIIIIKREVQKKIAHLLL